MKKWISSLFLSVVCGISFSCQVFAESSPFGYLTKEEIASLEMNTSPHTVSSEVSTDGDKAFADITQEVKQIQGYIDKGLYLEAINECNQALLSYKLSETDKARLEGLRNTATSNYKSYLEAQKNGKTQPSLNDNSAIKQAFLDVIKAYSDVGYETTELYPDYYIYDIEKDGIPELIIKRGTCEADYEYVIYKYGKNAAYEARIEEGIHSSLCEYDSGNGIVIFHSAQGYWSIEVLSVQDGIFVENWLASGNSNNYPYYKWIDDYKVYDTTGIITYFLPLDNKVGNEQSFANIINEINQIKSFINNGLYLEAVELCDKVAKNYTISPEDNKIINELRTSAKSSYDDYVNYLNYLDQFMTYYRRDWGMTFRFYKNIKPVSYGGKYDIDQYIDVYNSTAYRDSIKIYSYEIGTNYYWGTPYNINNTIGNLVAQWKIRAYQGDNFDVDFEVLSESDTMVGSFKARQATLRRASYEGRYKTSAYYDIVKLIAFQYGNWIYVIQAQQGEYNWTDDFWNMMELVRTSIDFV